VVPARLGGADVTERWVRFDGAWRSAGAQVLWDVKEPGAPGYTKVTAGAVLPITTANPTSDVVYVSPTGSDADPGTLAAPKATISAAVGAVAAGGTVLVRGGNYTLSEQRVSIGKSVTIRAYQGEIPYIDGSIAVSAGAMTDDGAMKKFNYTTIPCKKVADAIGLTTENFYPPATFDGSDNPTGLAAERGFANVTSSSVYAIPATQTKASINQLAAKNTIGARVITGIYSDQCWAGGSALIQVFVKSLVRQGYFYVSRTPSGSDPEPSQNVQMWVHSSDAALGIRVSAVVDATSPYLFLVNADNVSIKGLRIFGHSGTKAFYVIQTTAGASGLTVEDVEILDTAQVAMKLYGSETLSGGVPTFSGADLVKNSTLRRVTVKGAGWMGMSLMFTDDTLVTACHFENINRHSEHDQSPKSGAIKGGKNHRMVVEHCVFKDIYDAHGLWLDQSNYNCTIASSKFINIEGASAFWEISHKLLFVNNLVVHPATGINVRVSGGSGVRLINNTIIGGSNPLYVIAEKRGKQVNGRWLSEHVERYGGSGYNQDSGGYVASDLDPGHGGSYAQSNQTSGMLWCGGADEVTNNVIVHTQGSGMCVYYRPMTGDTSVNVEANLVVPEIMDGNIYSSNIGQLAQVEVYTAGGFSGNVGVKANLTAWRGSTGIGQAYYSYIVGKDFFAREGTGWVDVATGAPSAALIAAQGTAATGPSDAAVVAYVPSGNRHYGTYLVD
jgi:hypothetical protein